MKDRPYPIPKSLTEPQRHIATPCPSEHQECIALWEHLCRRHLFACHIPNEHSTAGERMRTSAIGLLPGMPDYLIFGPLQYDGRSWCGLAIEMKRANGGTLSEAQERQLEALRGHGWIAEVCHGAYQAVKLVEEVCCGR